MSINTPEKLKEAKESLTRMQKFKAATLPREGELGSELNFADAVAPAKQLVGLYKRLSVDALQDFPDSKLDAIKQHADGNYQLFNQILEFSAAQGNPQNARNSIIQQIKVAYEPAFNGLHPMISYSLHRAADFQRLDNEARAVYQSIKDKGEEFSRDMEEQRNSADSILEQIKKTAAEQGVSQQALYFKEESEYHQKEANIWQTRTIWVAAVLIGYSLVALFIHNLPGLNISSDNGDFVTYMAINVVTGKILIFAVIAYLLFLSAKNFLSHKHNAVVNKHRQNALMTFRALADAAKDESNTDVVLNHASACIFSPQDTGYTKTSANHPANANYPMVELRRRQLPMGGDEE